MGKKTSATKNTGAQQVDTDWEADFKVNPELADMANATKIWPKSTTTLDDLERLHEQRLLPPQSIAGWEATSDHCVPAP
jgi:hypothetical protein